MYIAGDLRRLQGDFFKKKDKRALETYGGGFVILSFFHLQFLYKYTSIAKQKSTGTLSACSEYISA